MSKDKLKISNRYIFLLSILLLCACDLKQSFPGFWPSPTPTLSPELIDRSWLTGKPCSPPCWYGLEIGKTTLFDAQEKINQLSFIDSKLTEWENPYLSFNCKEQNIDRCVILRFDNNKLSQIGILLNYKITLKEIVDIIGPPDSMLTGPNSPGEFFLTNCRIRFYWIERQLEIYFIDRDSYKECRKVKNAGYKPIPSMTINQVWIWEFNEKDAFGVPWTGFAEDK